MSKPALLTIGANVIILLILGLTTACTPPPPPASPTPWPSPTLISVDVTPTSTPAVARSTPEQAITPVVQTATTISVWADLSAAQTRLLAEDIAAFQQTFPQYAVSFQPYEGSEGLMTPLTAGQIEFDVVLASPVLLGHLWVAEQIAPMDNFFPPSFLDAFAAVTLAGAGRDGDIWGIPDSAGFHLLLFYNRDLVDAAPTNTTDLLALAETLTEGEQWGLGVNSYDPLWVIPWLPAFGDWFVDGERFNLDTPAMEAALTLYLGWQGRLTGVAPVETYDEARTKFVAGNMAMLIDGEWAIDELPQTSGLNWGVASLPNVGTAADNQPVAPLVLARYWAVSRTSTSDKAQAAAAFVEFISRPERQLIWLDQFGLLPTRREALVDPAILGHPLLRVSAAQMQAGRAASLGLNPNVALDAMREPLQNVIDGELTPREAAVQMQINVERR